MRSISSTFIAAAIAATAAFNPVDAASSSASASASAAASSTPASSILSSAGASSSLSAPATSLSAPAGSVSPSSSASVSASASLLPTGSSSIAISSLPVSSPSASASRSFSFSGSFSGFPSSLPYSSASQSVSASSSAVPSATNATSSAAPTSTLTPAKPINGDGGWADAMNKAKAFVAQLTIDEKVNLTTGVDTIGRCVGNSGTIPRLGFAGFCFEDSPVGVRDTDYASVFPASITVASTWDADLYEQRGAAMGAEFRGKGVNVALGPMMNLARAPEAGRNWEGAGADPFLQGVHAAANIKGIQSQGVIACAKHYIANEQEHYRGGGGGEAYSSNLDPRTLHEDQLWPFAESVYAGVGSVMCAYNRFNQTEACENRYLLNEILKEELDFQGFMLSDWAAVTSLYASVMNGADVNQPGFVAYGDPDEGNPATANNSWWGAALGDAVRNGSIPMSRFDDMVTRLMAAYYKLGQDQNFPAVNFDYNSEDTYYDGQLVNEHVNVQADHYKLIREIGAAATILLKNSNNTLPLNVKKIRNLAIFGSDAGPNPDGPNGCEDGNIDRGCSQGTLALGWGSGTANFPYLIDPYSAIQNYVHQQSPDTVIMAQFTDFNLAQAGSYASQADTCLVFGNADSGEGYITVDGNAGDRNNLTLWHGGDALIGAVTAQCDNTIVVLHTPAAVLMEDWIENPNVTAVLYAHMPGQESGNAILDILTGTVNPSGRLPYTIAKQRSDYPADVLYNAGNDSSAFIPQIDYTEKLNIDYRHFDTYNITPRFEFGYGLSYTTFSYEALSLSVLTDPYDVPQGQVQPGGRTGLWTDVLQVAFSIKNTGSVAGNEVAQVYVGFPPSAGEPPRVLRGFERQLIQAGETAQYVIKLRLKDISIWDESEDEWVVPSGTFTIYVGSSSRQLHLTKTISF